MAGKKKPVRPSRKSAQAAAQRFVPNPEFLKPQRSGKAGAPMVVIAAAVMLMLGAGALFYFAEQRPLPTLVSTYPVPPIALQAANASRPANQQIRYEVLNRSGRRLTSPILTSEAVRQWAGRRSTEAFTYNFVEFDTEIARLRPYFTADGYEAFLTALERAQAKEVVQQRGLVVSAVMSGDPIVTNRKVNLDGTRQWNVQTPVDVTFSAGNVEQSIVRRLIVQTTLISRPSAEVVTGLAIKNFLAIPAPPKIR
ncbi:MAG: hypothetical protein Alpg2KO_24810 [Alphaproteobacteria bacterium]